MDIAKAKIRLNRKSPIPLYYQLKEVIRNQIKANAYKEHEMLPSENELVEMYDVSRHVARRALAELAQEGLIFSRKGVGSFVNARRYTKQLSILGSFTHSLKAVSPDSTSLVIQQGEVAPGTTILEALELPSDAKVVLIQRVGFIDGEPIAETKAYFPPEIGRVFIDKDLSDQSLYQLLSEDKKIEPHRAEWLLRVIPATAEQAALLDIREGFPLICNYGTTYTRDNRPFEYSELSYRSDRIEFAITGFRRDTTENRIMFVDM